MHVNKISVNTNFGVRLTPKAILALKRSGATDFDLGTLSCKTPTEALIGITKYGTHPYIEGKDIRIEAYGKKLNMKMLNELCTEYNTEKFFSVLKTTKKPIF